MMDKQSIEFATVKQDNTIQNISKSVWTHPQVHYEENSKPTNWFDDNKLLKKGGANYGISEKNKGCL